MVLVATRFTDGTKLNIEQTYISPEDPFTTNVEEPKKPIDEKREEKRELNIPRENVTITPQQDKYRQVSLQKREPAYVRQRSQFEVESESQPSNKYQHQIPVQDEEAKPSGGDSMLF